MKYHLLLLFLLVETFAIAQPEKNPTVFRSRINLKGKWSFSLDTANAGINEKWFMKKLPDEISLPGTTDSNQKGFLNKDSSTMHLSRIYRYEGPAWYRKKVTIPKSFRDKHIRLFLERTKPSQVWVDGKLIGKSILLQSPHEYDLSSYLTSGDHFITIRIDNSLKLTPYGNVHIYSDDTQTNWNGIVGEMYLEASTNTFISDLQVYPDIVKKKIDVKLKLNKDVNSKDVAVDLMVEKTSGGKSTRLKSPATVYSSDSLITLEYILANNTELWDEYKQPLYKLTAVISQGKTKDSKSVNFGMRKFSVKGTQFQVNGRTTFLRGKHDAAVFPLTGHAPMNVEGWTRVFKIAKNYGINHYRFHSWCPPAAAFTAADHLGIYLQPELPFWGGLEQDSVAGMLRLEGLAMLKHYANHPSFVMFSHGNEIWSGQKNIEQNIIAFKNYDSRPLYTMGSNVNLGFYAPQPSTDFFVAVRTPSNGDTTLTHVRLTNSFADSKDGGILNSWTPSTEVKFQYPVGQLKIPIVSHEIGQYQVYPDYREIDKYTGVLRPRNLEVFRNRLKAAGMMDQNSAFQKASGAWAALCYKAEMEAALRTPGFGGFQLLDLQDFPGQGTALVGILDAFMDSKNVVSREDWRQSCNDVTLLLEFPKYCWTNKEIFSGKLTVANYSNHSIDEQIKWEVKNQKGIMLKNGVFSNSISSGGLNSAGDINFVLSTVSQSEKLTINITINNTTYKNSYPIWVYPESTPVNTASQIEIATSLNAEVLRKLQEGRKVLLFPQAEDVKQNTVGGLFPPDFWNWGMFKGISESNKKPVSPGTLGLLMNPEHPLFNSFPTDFYTNWQWFSIIKESTPFILNNTEHKYRPIVQVIDNLERNNKLGLIFEFKVGSGKLLVCMSQLNKIMDKPEAVQLYRSIVNYMDSKHFNPEYELTFQRLEMMFGKTVAKNQ